MTESTLLRYFWARRLSQSSISDILIFAESPGFVSVELEDINREPSQSTSRGKLMCL